MLIAKPCACTVSCKPALPPSTLGKKLDLHYLRKPKRGREQGRIIHAPVVANDEPGVARCVSLAGVTVFSELEGLTTTAIRGSSNE